MVVHPEVRGIGLSRILIQAAEEFCKTRWNIRTLRPLFLEITADMLKFMPFVHGAGMRWIGDSTGNLSRINKDMEYLAAKVKSQEDHWINRHDRKGIASVQRKNVHAIIQLEEQLSHQKLDVFMELEKIIRDETTAPETYEKLMPLLRLPKPTYMKGLTRNADAFIQRRCVELGLEEPKQDELHDLQVCSSPVHIKNLTLEFAFDTGFLGRPYTGRIRRAFGLSREFRFRTGIRNLSVTVHPGEICYLYGSSGAGKTWLLRLLANLPDWKEKVPVTGEVSLPSNGKIGTLEGAIPAGPLVQAIGPKSLGHAIAALNASGLAEPRLYLSRYEELSAGQKYRAQLARLLCSDSNIWLLDEFSSNLDDATALAVGRNFARAARKREVICFIATVRRQPLVNAISPDLVVELNQVGEPNVWRDWRDWKGLS
jgi:ABC-type ATPase with predicted acetyltransferase domain